MEAVPEKGEEGRTMSLVSQARQLKVPYADELVPHLYVLLPLTVVFVSVVE